MLQCAGLAALSGGAAGIVFSYWNKLATALVFLSGFGVYVVSFTPQLSIAEAALGVAGFELFGALAFLATIALSWLRTI